MEKQENNILNGIAYLCFIPYSSSSSSSTTSNNNTAENLTDNIQPKTKLNFDSQNNNNCDTTNKNTAITTDKNNDKNDYSSNNSYHWFQGIFISLPNKISYGLMGDTTESPPIPHPCCYPDKNNPPKFYNLTMIDYTTNRKTFIKYILQTGGDNISLSTDWEPDDFVLDEKIQKIKNNNPFFKFNTLSVKCNEEAVEFMKNYFPKLKPELSCIICIGNLEIEIKK
ncbi:hypothetical protein BCR36DRAFT_413013 [Piromyces finnis]|uniref:Uncharacterized protein n=1 Tax=Piromyces finnis TaxID=1754191 RepID=A0A1Y1V8I0_9FUNG|nr:hypothetical protein BCR36DRAFT_413013 [Piromyces finnis]|eukprot:ORX49013.1 hypothetical protein BCR36DRAFT_413013 [Piromyces finnis]